jgi:hypothetical protein
MNITDQKFTDLPIKGMTFQNVYISANKEQVVFELTDSRRFIFAHNQDCCEHVSVDDVIGDLEDIIQSPLIVAEECSQDDPEADESGTWTFYRFVTLKGCVVIKWYGSSNGYYSESVDYSWQELVRYKGVDRWQELVSYEKNYNV